MIVMFQGTNVANNAVAGASGIAATLSAAKYNRKTLYMQLTSTDATNTEKLLIGKRKSDSEIMMENLKIEDKGIDALMRRAVLKKLTKDHFDMSCEPLLVKYENMLDSAAITKQEDFESNLTLKEVQTIINCAKNVYDNVFILLNGKNTTIMQELLELCDVYVTCFSQNPQKEPFNEFEGKRSLKLITDYDKTSAYNAAYLKKSYKEKKMYIVPHNSGYRDACLSENLLEFILKNMNNTHEDENFNFMKHLLDLMEGIMGKENWEEEVPEPIALPEKKKGKKTPLQTIEEDDFFVEEVEEKKGFFGRLKKKRKITLVDEREDSVELEDGFLERERLRYSAFDEEDEVEDDEVVIASELEEESAYEEDDDEVELTESENEEEATDTEKTLMSVTPIHIPVHKPQTKKSEYVSGKLEKTTIKKKPQTAEKTADDEEEKKVWVCPSCGTENTAKFCGECGTTKPVEKTEIHDTTWTCPSCGTENETKFCSECGTKKPEKKSNTWTCPDCGTVNTTRFCSECGRQKS